MTRFIFEKKNRNILCLSVLICVAILLIHIALFRKLKKYIFQPRLSLSFQCVSLWCQPPGVKLLTLEALKDFCINHGKQRFFQLEIIMNAIVSSFCFIWILMLWVYDHWKYIIFFSAGTVFIRQNLPSVDGRFWRIKTVPALKGLNYVGL